ncbi:MAG: GDSL-type esterase/lipase family protein [Candidatus Binatia bacterium]
MKRGRELLARVLLALGGIAFACVLLEVGARWQHLVPDRFWEPDAVLGLRLVPGYRGWWTQEDREFLVPVQINREGLRDVEHQYVKPAGVFRILVLGDSFVEAMHVPLEATFPRLLQQRLNVDGEGGRVEVVSAGVSGYGTASELLYFEREGKRYQPDLVLLAFYPGNDVKNNSSRLEETLKPVYTPDGALQKVVAEGPRTPPEGWRGLLARSAAYHYLRQVLLIGHPQLAHSLVQHRLLKAEAVRAAPEQDGLPVDYGIYAPSLQPAWQEAWDRTEQLLRRLQRDVSAGGAQLAIAVLSTRDQIYPQWWQEIVAAHPRMQNEPWDLDAPQHRMEAWCAQHGVPCLALAPAFRAAAGTGAPLHYHHDGHWTVAGHRLAANELAHFLEAHRLVPTQQTGVTRNETH